MAIILKQSFYQGNTLDIAKNLIGFFLMRKIGRKIIRAVITDVEAYVGESDLACHASKGRTPRTETMYGKAGHAYVYMVYGMYHCLNIVTEKKDFPAAVLIRGIKIEKVDYQKTNGPGKLCKFLEVDKKLNGWDVTKGEKLWVVCQRQVRPGRIKIKKAKRIGIDYAGHCKHYLWRFYI